MERMETDIAIIGAGPAGLAVACDLQHEGGRQVLILEKGVLADAITQYPTYMTYFSTGDLLELCGFPLTIPREKPTRQDYLNYLRRFAKDKNLNIKTGREVTELEGSKGAFTLRGRDRWGEPFEVRAGLVVIAIGASEWPQKLNIPGEDLPHVTHYYKEIHPYFASKVVVIGGGNSAVETALELWRGGVEVAIVHRREKFKTLKYWLEPDIENRIKKGEIACHRPARAVEIKPHSVLIETADGARQEIPSDFVVIQTGYRPDPAALARFGIRANPENGRPIHNPETLESERPGLYIAGVMLAGNVSSEIFIENSRLHGRQILKHLREGGRQGG